MRKAKNEQIDNSEQIKRLLILGLIHQGVQGKTIASVLGVAPATISRIAAARQIKKIN